MLKTVETSRAQKTKGLAVTYRAGSKEKFSTCPATCELNPSGCGATAVDLEYLDALSNAVPTKGIAFTYSHFAPRYWMHKNGPGKTVINFSAKTPRMATYVGNAVPTVVTVPPEFWADRKTVETENARFVRCPAEYLPQFGCAQCGNGDPLCARLERDFVIGFTAHGVHKKKAANPGDPGGCYASGGNVLLHWEATADQAQDESDADKVTRFAKSLAPRTILRHHIAGDIGDD